MDDYYDVCHNCANAIENSDYSAIDETELPVIEGFVEILGMDYYLTGPFEHSGYWECESCERLVVSDDGYRFARN